VERPASVVKELIENSIDAGASDIRVEVTGGGQRLIRVVDDGAGIPADQAVLAFERHATSKIRNASDLEHVETLGFRGEALAAIAAVSQVTLVTRTRQVDAGVEVRFDNGRLVSQRSVGAPVGTSVTVENLFDSVPARKRFLRRDATEAAHVQETVARYAEAHPELRFSLVRAGRLAFQSPGSGELHEVLVVILGVDVARDMIELPPLEITGGQSGQGAVRVGGYVSPTHVHRATRSNIALFVNGRWIRDRSLTYAVVQAYHTFLPKGRYPIAVIHIAVPVERVDVNVHPAKTEVRFRDAGAVFAAVQRAVRSAVVGGAPVPPVGIGEGRHSALPRGASHPASSQRPVSWSPEREGGEAVAETQATFLPGTAGDLPPLRVLGQVSQTFIVAEGPDGLYLIDQHAAHERVMYEELLGRGETTAGQRLLSPVTVVLSPAQMDALELQLAAFSRLGFDVERFGPDTALVRAVPDVLTDVDVAETLRTVLDLTAEGASPVEEAMEERVIRAVCKQATVKAGQTLSQSEMQSLIRRLEATTSPRTCPHGRPTVVVLTTSRLAREFGRT